MSYTPPPMSPPPGGQPPGSYPPNYPPQGGWPPQGPPPGHPGAPPPHGGYGRPVPPPPPPQGGGDNTVTIVIGVVIAVIILGGFALCCCCFGMYAGAGAGFAGLGNDPWDDWYDSGWYDSGTAVAAYEDWVWGDLKVTKPSVNVYSTNSTTSTVLETGAKDETFSYYGYDDTFTYYKIKTTSGSDGYVLTTEVEPVYVDTYAATDYRWGAVKITVTSASVYTTASSSSTILESLGQGTRVDYYGFDDTYNFYRVKTASGNEGYVKLLDGEIEY